MQASFVQWRRMAKKNGSGQKPPEPFGCCEMKYFAGLLMLRLCGRSRHCRLLLNERLERVNLLFQFADSKR